MPFRTPFEAAVAQLKGQGVIKKDVELLERLKLRSKGTLSNYITGSKPVSPQISTKFYEEFGIRISDFESSASNKDNKSMENNESLNPLIQSKNETIAAKDQVIASKEETIIALKGQLKALEEKQSNLIGIGAAVQTNQGLIEALYNHLKIVPVASGKGKFEAGNPEKSPSKGS